MTPTTTDFIEEKVKERKLKFGGATIAPPEWGAQQETEEIQWLRTTLQGALSKGAEIERERILALAGGEPYIYVPKI